MAQHVNHYQRKVGEIEQSVRSLVNTALFYLNDPSLPGALANARRCLETSKYVLEGIYIPSTPEESIEPLAHAGRNRWPDGMVESWGFVNNVDDPHKNDHPHYPM